MRSLTPSFFGATYEKMEKYGCVQWPCKDESDADLGTMYLHKYGIFATPDHKGQLFAAEWRPPYEVEDEDSVKRKQREGTACTGYEQTGKTVSSRRAHRRCGPGSQRFYSVNHFE